MGKWVIPIYPPFFSAFSHVNVAIAENTRFLSSRGSASAASPRKHWGGDDNTVGCVRLRPGILGEVWENAESEQGVVLTGKTLENTGK